jgi:serine/threonine protein kinase
VRYLGSEQILDNFCIYLEYMPGGSLSSIMDKHGAMLDTTV